MNGVTDGSILRDKLRAEVASIRTATEYEVAKITKDFGGGTLTRASDLRPRAYRTSGSIALDTALGGGWAQGTVVDVIGRQGAGKTLIFMVAAVAAQRAEGKPSVLFDYEQTFSPRLFEALGGDLDMLYLVRAENFSEDKEMFIEWCIDMLKAQLRTKMFACIAMDSTAGMVSKAEFDIKEAKGEEASTMAYTARAMSSLCRQVCGSGMLARSDTTLFFMSQMRDNIGGRSIKGIPPPDKVTGGRALRFFASNQVEISRGDTYKGDLEHEGGMVEKDVEVGHETKVRVRKNKNNAVQGRVAAIDFYTQGDIIGLDYTSELIKLAIATNVIQRAGSWFSYGVWKRQGEDSIREYFNETPSIRNEIDAKTREALAMQMQVLPAEEIIPEDPDEALIAKLEAQEVAALEAAKS